MFDFFQTRRGQMLVDKTIPSLVSELHNLQEELKLIRDGLISTIETTSVEVDEADIATAINTFSKDGWQVRHCISSRKCNVSGRMLKAVLVLERKK